MYLADSPGHSSGYYRFCDSFLYSLPNAVIGARIHSGVNHLGHLGYSQQLAHTPLGQDCARRVNPVHFPRRT